MYKVEKVTAQSGRLWLRIIESGYDENCATVFTPASIFDSNRAGAFRHLAAIGVVLPGRKAQEYFLAQVGEAKLIHDPRFIDAPGWSGDCFVLLNGKYHVPAGARSATIAFADQ